MLAGNYLAFLTSPLAKLNEVTSFNIAQPKYAKLQDNGSKPVPEFLRVGEAVTLHVQSNVAQGDLEAFVVDVKGNAVPAELGRKWF
jgi:hypothetical protein